MTVITTIISNNCCAHASDSYITIYNQDKQYEIIEKRKSKIISVKKFNGALVYWGLAKIKINNKEWFTYDYLKEKSNDSRNFSNPEDFANSIRDELTDKFLHTNFAHLSDSGLGIHFSAYEEIDGKQIPELFVIRNFEGIKYREVNPQGFNVTRNTFCIIPDEYKNKFDTNSTNSINESRKIVSQYLQEGHYFIFNNGDPDLSSFAINGLLQMVKIAGDRKILVKLDEAKTYRQMALWIVNCVSEFQTKFIIKGQRIVGGNRHNLSITPTKLFNSDTGDK